MSTVVANAWKNPDGTENYKCRAWVNFNGTGTVAIRESGNVSSITDRGTGEYTANLSSALPDANASVSGVPAGNNTLSSGRSSILTAVANSTTAMYISIYSAGASSLKDEEYVSVAIFR